MMHRPINKKSATCSWNFQNNPSFHWCSSDDEKLQSFVQSNSPWTVVRFSVFVVSRMQNLTIFSSRVPEKAFCDSFFSIKKKGFPFEVESICHGRKVMIFAVHMGLTWKGWFSIKIFGIGVIFFLTLLEMACDVK